MHPLVSAYKKAWETQDPSLLPTIFATDAVYESRPWQHAKGLVEIEKYWHEKVIPQEKITFEIVRECVNHDRIWLEWKVLTHVANPRRAVFLTGAMIIELSSGSLIKRLTEYYFKEERPLE